MGVFILFLYLRPFNEIVLLALVFLLGILGIMLYTREHKNEEASDLVETP